MLSTPDKGFVYPKTGGPAGSEGPMDADLRFHTTPTYVSSGSFYFDGTDDRINITGLGVTSQGNWSITAWVKLLHRDATANNNLLKLQNAAGQRFQLTLEGPSDKTNIQIYDEANDSQLSVGPNAALWDNTWHHVACCASNSGKTWQVYIDGLAIAAAATFGSAVADLSSPNSGANTECIGARESGSDSECFGNICHVGVWHDTLSQDEVRALMTATTYAEAITKGGSTPRAYYLLEADADDSVGTQDGAAVGAVAVGDRARLPSGLDLTGNQMNAQCFTGRAVAFDGSADHFENSHPISTTASTAQTMTCWVKASDWTAGNIISNATVSSNNALFIYAQNDNLGIHCRTASTTTKVGCSYVPSVGVWHHVVATFNTSDPASPVSVLYVDGKDASGTALALATGGNDGLLEVGGSGAAQNVYFAGSIADVKLFDVILTAAQVLELYENPELAVPTGVSTGDLIHHFPLCDYDIPGSDGLNTLLMQNLSQRNKPLTCTGGTMEFEQPAPCPQMAFRSNTPRCLFNDSNTVLRLDPSGTDIDCSGAFTYLFWVQTFTANTDARLIDANAGAGPVIFIDAADSGFVRVRTKVDFGGTFHTWDTPNNVIPIGEWVHLGITFAGGDTNEIVYYVNGSSVAVTPPTGTPSGTQGADSGVKDIGGTGSTVVWDGFISEFAIFAGTQLDADAVAAVYNSGIQGFDLLSDSGNYDVSSSLSGWWKTSQSINVPDLKGSTDATWNNLPNIATAPEGSTSGLTVFGDVLIPRPAFGIAGNSIKTVNDGKSFTRIPDCDFGTGNLTISFWWRMHRPLVVNMDICATYDESAGIDFYVGSTTGIKLYVKGPTGTLVHGSLITDAGGFKDRWYHTVIRREATSTWSLYLRGAGEAQIAAPDLTGTDVGSLSAQTTLVFGGRNHANTYNTGASYCFPKVWIGEALTDGQCDELHEQGLRFLRGL